MKRLLTENVFGKKLSRKEIVVNLVVGLPISILMILAALFA